eukprot:scaffold10399_cov94-Isochrysis_galbana.AAC.3
MVHPSETCCGLRVKGGTAIKRLQARACEHVTTQSRLSEGGEGKNVRGCIRAVRACGQQSPKRTDNRYACDTN